MEIKKNLGICKWLPDSNVFIRTYTKYHSFRHSCRVKFLVRQYMVYQPSRNDVDQPQNVLINQNRSILNQSLHHAWRIKSSRAFIHVRKMSR